METSVRLDVGSGPPIVLLHGFPGNGQDWVPVAELLSDGFRVVVVDLLGFGGSPRPSTFEDLWVDAQAAALASTLDRLGLERVALIGHDYGGPVALTFLRRFPDRVSHLGVLATNAWTDTPVDFPLSALKLPLIGPMLDRVFFSTPALRILGRAASRTRGVRAAVNDPAEARSIRRIFGPVLRNLADLYAEVERSLESISVPAVVVWGSRDPFFPEAQGRRTAESIPGAEFVLLAGSGHFVQLERPREVAGALRSLLQRSAGG